MEDTTSEHQISERINFRHGFRYKVLKTVVLVVFWITSGLFNSMTGATFVDFKEILHTDFEKIGIVMVFRTVGSLFGSIIGSVLRDKAKVRAELILGVTSATCSVVNFLKPWSKTVAVYGILNTVEGIAQTCASTVINALLLVMWGKKASMPVHSFHFGYGLGAFLGPLLVKDFLSVRCPSGEVIPNDALHNYSMTGHSYVSHTCQNSTDDNPVILQAARLEIPFAIVSGMLIIISVGIFAFYIVGKCSPRQKVSEPLTKTTDEKKKSIGFTSCRVDFLKSFSFRFVGGMFFLYMCINTFEGVVYAYLFTFAFESHIGFSKQEAAYLLSAYLGSYTGSRLLVTFVAHFVTVKVLIFIETIGSLGALLAMTFYGFQSKLAMWISACCLGVFVASIWPSGLAWADRYVPVKASVVAVADLGAGISGSICSWLASHFITVNQIPSYLYVASSGCTCALLLIIVLQIIGHRHGDRHKIKANRRTDPTS